MNILNNKSSNINHDHITDINSQMTNLEVKIQQRLNHICHKSYQKYINTMNKYDNNESQTQFFPISRKQQP